MANAEYLVAPNPLPDLKVPSSSSTVTVRVIDSTAHGNGPAHLMLTPPIPGHERLIFPCFSFLISNAAKNKHILFDNAIRKDYWNLPPMVAARVTGDNRLFEVNVEKNVADILDADEAKLGVTSKDISAVIWSHHHWDHTGDMTTFPSSTDLVIGPGFQKEYLPGYPTNDKSALLESDFKDRNVREIAESQFSLKIGRFPAFDYFGDGSFYLLHSPGHTVGHMCGLARTTENTFIFMGGDACHHGGEFRPTGYMPLPKEVARAPLSRFGAGCPGAFLVEKIHPFSSATEPFYDIAKGFSHDHDEAKRSISKLQEFDASDDVLVCIAHDGTMMGNVDFYPKPLNDWKAQGIQKKIRWAFVGDFDLKADRLPRKEGESAVTRG